MKWQWLHGFYKIFRVCEQFFHELSTKIWGCTQGVPELWGLKYVLYFRAPLQQNYTSDVKTFRGARMVYTSSVTMPSMVWLVFHTLLGEKNVRCLFFVCLSVMLLNGRVCANDFAVKAL